MTVTVETEALNREHCNIELINTLRRMPMGTVESDWDVEIINDVERGRWFSSLGAEPIAELQYLYVGGRVVLVTIWVDPGYRRSGVAAELIAHALDEVRQQGKTITVVCPVVGAFIERNPGYADLLDRRRPGSGAHPAQTAEVDDDTMVAEVEADMTAD